MKRWLAEMINRIGFGEEDLPSLGIAALSAAAILAMAAAMLYRGRCFSGLPA